MEGDDSYKFGSDRVVVLPYDWRVEEEGDGTFIYSWCLNRESEPCLIRLKYNVSCYVELPLFVDNKRITWTKTLIDKVLGKIKNALGGNKNDSHAPTSYRCDEVDKLYYHRGGTKYRVLQLFFKRWNHMNHCQNLLAKDIQLPGVGWLSLNVLETEIKADNKLLKDTKVKRCGWYSVSAKLAPDDDKVSSLKNEYLGDYRQMGPVPDVVCRNWKVHPGILSYDIETWTDNRRAMPNRYNPAHVAYLISCIYQRIGLPKTRRCAVLLLGDCKLPEGTEDVELIKCVDELELGDKLAEVILDMDPEIITGYNILNYDNQYLHSRRGMYRVGPEADIWPVMGRLLNRAPVMEQMDWSSSAYSHNSISNLYMHGRIAVDMLPFVRRNHKMRLYNLDVVSKKFLGRGKHDVKPQEMFRIYANLQDYLEEGKEPPLAVLEEMGKVVLYCIEDSQLVIELFEQLNTWSALTEMANITCTNMVDLYIRGQQIRCYQQLYEEAANSKIMLNKPPPQISRLSGGTVVQGAPGIHEIVLPLDFKSLYPSIIMAMNFSYETLVPEELWGEVAPDDCHIVKIIQMEPTDVKGVKVEKNYEFRFLKGPEGLYPRIERKLIEGRDVVRLELKICLKEQDGVKRALETCSDTERPVLKQRLIDLESLAVQLDAKQLALKVVANSMFGFWGTRDKGYLPFIEGAIAITGMGRELIGVAAKYVTDTYPDASIAYGDTDSIFARIPEATPITCHYWGKRLADEITKLFPSPLQLVSERPGKMIFITKKRYILIPYNEKGELMFNDATEKGILTARRDNCPFQRAMFHDVLECAKRSKPIWKAARKIVYHCTRMIRAEVDVQDCAFVVTLGAKYKNETAMLNVFAQRLRKEEKDVQPGDRLEFVLCDVPGATRVGEMAVLLEDFENQPYPINTLKYIEKCKKSVQQLFNVAYQKEIEIIGDRIAYQLTNRHKVVMIDEFVSLIVAVDKGKKSFEDLPGAIKRKLKSETA